ncbi:MAG TPA: amidohydrolase family protein [Acidobacteriaceae bacterium]|jgi:L-fuconolactonase|nr:amidohydrolase family protein [Acidobacteriaceae bacterium]
MPAECIDAHHHLWKYVPEHYPWMAENMAVLRRDYLADDLAAVAHAAGVTGTVVVQARQRLEETEWLSAIAAHSSLIRGVVGWAPLADESAPAVLEKFAALPKIRGMRHVLHDEPDDFYMLRDDFNRGVAHLHKLNLRYDLLIFEKHLPQTIQFVDRHPHQIFIVDHIAKPRIRDRLLSPWREQLAQLAQRENVYCKLSGMVTEANWSSWTEADLQPYFETALEAFGPNRLMFGSDWPVLTLAASCSQWIETARRALAALSPHEQQRIFHDTAVEAYGLEAVRPASPLRSHE